MSLNFKLQCHFILLLLTALRGDSRYLEVSHPSLILNTFPVSVQPGTAGKLLILFLLHPPPPPPRVHLDLLSPCL